MCSPYLASVKIQKIENNDITAVNPIFSIFWSTLAEQKERVRFRIHSLFRGFFKFPANHTQGKVISYVGFTTSLNSEKRPWKRIAYILWKLKHKHGQYFIYNTSKLEVYIQGYFPMDYFQPLYNINENKKQIIQYLGECRSSDIISY